MVSRTPVVLLVEDDPGDVLLVTEALERCPIPPLLHVAGDGQEALDFLHRHGVYSRERTGEDVGGDAGERAGVPRPDLILLDLNMPRLDGRQALAAIKADPQLKAIPVVVFTTSDAESDVWTSYHARASAFVTKPLDLEDIEAVVAQISHFYTSISALLPPEPHAA